MHQSEPTHIRIHIYAYPTAIFLHQIFSTKNERESERREGGGLLNVSIYFCKIWYSAKCVLQRVVVPTTFFQLGTPPHASVERTTSFFEALCERLTVALVVDSFGRCDAHRVM